MKLYRHLYMLEQHYTKIRSRSTYKNNKGLSGMKDKINMNIALPMFIQDTKAYVAKSREE